MNNRPKKKKIAPQKLSSNSLCSRKLVTSFFFFLNQKNVSSNKRGYKQDWDHISQQFDKKQMFNQEIISKGILFEVF